MTAHRDPDRLIRAFLMEGQTELADPVFDAVRDRIEQTPQRAVIGPWRTPIMNRFVRIGLAAIAVVVVAVVGYQYLGSSNTGGPDLSHSAEPTATAEPSVSEDTSGEPTASPPTATEFVIGSPFLQYAQVRASSREGWEQQYNFVRRSDQRIGFSAWMTGGVYTDPCVATSLVELDPPVLDADPTLSDQIVQLLLEQASRQPSAPVEVSISGWGTTRIEMSVPADLDLGTCYRGKYTAWTDTSDPSGGNWNHQPGQTDIVYVVNIDRWPVMIHAWLRADATPDDRVELEAMLASVKVGFPDDFAPSPSP